MAKQSFTAAERREQFLNAGIELARKVGIHRLSSAAVAAKCKVTGPMVFYAFGSTANMRNEIIKAAKKAGIPLDTPAPVRQRKVAKVAKVASSKFPQQPTPSIGLICLPTTAG